MDPVRDQLQQALGAAYLVDRELGGGGMSRVFLSTETALDRRVVLKILPPDLASGVSVDRFKREISLAARLQHAHIVPLLSAGDANGLPWFSMPYVEGESLRARLGRGELPMAEAVRTMRDVASALAYAHTKGVVHRDIKPENILLAGGSASVADFGVAKAVEASQTNPGSSLTSVGMALGTPAYMSPEQAAGDERTDHRADIYAFGVVAYEMLAGRNPFAGRSPQATLAAHMTETAAPVEQARQATPPALAQLVNRCLAKSAADRPQTAQEIVHALDALVTPTGTIPLTAASGAAPSAARRPFARVLIAVAVTVVVAAGGWFGWRATRGLDVDPRTVAVLPFDVISSDTAVVQAARVAADWLMQGIMQTDSANVVSSTMVNFAIGDAKSATAGATDVITRVAKATRAGTMVTGSASRFGDSLRFQVTIIDARTGKIIRAIEPVAGAVADPIPAINMLRDRLLGAIVSGDVSKRSLAASGQPPGYAAYKEYMAGAEVFARDQVAAHPYFHRAIALDSTFPGPYFLLATSFTNRGLRDSAAAIIGLVDHFRDRLSRVDLMAIDFFRAMTSGDYETQARVAKELVTRTGDPMWEYAAGVAANALLRPDVAMPALEASDSALWVWKYQNHPPHLATAYHLAGDFAKEAAHVALVRKRYPDIPGFMVLALRSLAGLRNGPAALALADTILRGSNDATGLAGLNAVTTGAWEFEAHGDTATARQLLEMGLQWVASRKADAPHSRAMHRALGVAWLDLAQLDSATVHLTAALPDTSFAGIGTRAYLAIASARRGDTLRARAISDSLAASVREWDLGNTPYWRAAILATLGEKTEAVRLLRTAHQSGVSKAGWHYHPALRALRGFSEFEALIRPQK
jgi:serine/threonine-protein kinase